MEDQQKRKQKKEKEMDLSDLRHFIQLMLDAQDQGFLTSNTFTKPKFEEISKEIQSRTKHFFTAAFLQLKYGQLRADWRLYKALHNFSGVSVDPMTGAIQADPEQWDDWIKQNSKVKKFRSRGLEFFGEMTKLFYDSTASGEYNLPRGVVPANSDEERETEEVFRSSAMNMFGRMTVEGVPNSGQTFEIGGSSKKSGKRVMNIGGSSGGQASKKSRDSREPSYDVVVDHWVEKQSAKAKDDLLSECMDILNGMQLPDIDTYVNGTKYLAHPPNRTIFKKATSELRVHLIRGWFP
ncbi:OLC1v1030733C1 [Oldenlandia corymbosa var. corymbosa]|uniref:OLC1v1030733C1 n=1 Tax=Oldenlandia corymbosa var. corymbosa TaxID=529605 RepID=A0AAV1CJN9_OLDCO|nr:OLC1v1030733C1 [Oldenlandia corymbosa var. corymbosa]